MLLKILVFLAIMALIKYLFGSNTFKKFNLPNFNFNANFYSVYVILLLLFIFIGPVVFLYLGTHEKYTDLFIKSVSMGTIVFFGSILVLIIYSFIFNKMNRTK